MAICAKGILWIFIESFAKQFFFLIKKPLCSFYNSIESFKISYFLFP